MADLPVRDRPAVQRHGLHVLVRARKVLRDDGERPAAGQGDGRLRNLRRADHVFAAARIEGIESERGEDVPGGHLSAVVVAAESVRLREVEPVEHFAYALRRLPVLADERVEVDDVVAGLVAVDVLSDKSGDVHHLALSLRLLGLGEESVELPDERFAPAKRLDEPVRILHHVPGVLEGVAFGEVVCGLSAVSERVGIERLAPTAIGIPSADQSERPVEDVLPAGGAPEEEFRIVLPAEFLGHPAGAPVVVGALERPRNRLAPDDVEGIVSIPVVDVPVLLPAPGMLLGERLLDLVVDPLPAPFRLFALRLFSFLEEGVDNDGYRVRAYHALVVASPQRPDGEVAGGPALAGHGGDERGDRFRRDDRVERMRGAEGVPRGKRGIIRILSVVRDVVRLDEKVVEGGVEVLLLVFRPVDGHAGETLRPLLASGGRDAVEVPAGDFRGEVLLRVGNSAEGGERDLDDERFAGPEVEVEDAVPARSEGMVEDDLVGIGAPHPVVDRHLAEDGGPAVVLHLVGLSALLRPVPSVEAPFRVDEKPLAGVRGIRDPVDCAVLGGGHLDLDSAESGGVVSGGCLFGRLVERDGFGSFGGCERQQANVAEVGASGSVEVRLGESEDGPVVVAIAGAMMPVAVAGVGSGLDEPERNARRRSRVTRRRRPDERIDVCARGVRGNTDKRRAERGCRNSHLHHSQFLLFPAPTPGRPLPSRSGIVAVFWIDYQRLVPKSTRETRPWRKGQARACTPASGSGTVLRQDRRRVRDPQERCLPATKPQFTMTNMPGLRMTNSCLAIL